MLICRNAKGVHGHGKVGNQRGILHSFRHDGVLLFRTLGLV